MNRKTLILIVIALILISIIVFFVVKNNPNFTEEDEEIKLNYSESTDEDTGETTYTIYDENTGEVIAETSDESMIQMYMDDPEFVGSETELTDIEEHDDEDIVSGSVWGNTAEE